MSLISNFPASLIRVRLANGSKYVGMPFCFFSVANEILPTFLVQSCFVKAKNDACTFHFST